MIQFSLNRFGKLAKWTLSFDKVYYIKSFLQMLIGASLLFVVFTTRFFTFNANETESLFAPCVMIYVGALAVHLLIAPGVMFYSFKHKRDDQAYMMLPASNFEKYLARYAASLLMVFVLLPGLLAADVVQFVVNMLLGAENHLFVLSFMIEKLSHMAIMQNLTASHVASGLIAFLWTQSIYALGATFFRSHKYAWIFTTLVLIVGTMCFSWAALHLHADWNTNDETPLRTVWMINVVNLIWACVNFWLSFKCFCRSQVIGKYINL